MGVIFEKIDDFDDHHQKVSEVEDDQVVDDEEEISIYIINYAYYFLSHFLYYSIFTIFS